MNSVAPTISLFTGAGGLDLGVSAAGARIAVAVENDPDCHQTLLSNPHFAQAPILSDITALSGEEILEAGSLSLGEVALLIGGPPCQPFSKAGYWTSTGDEARRREQRARASGGADLDLPSGSETSTVSKGRPRHVAGDSRSGLVGDFARVLREVWPEGFIFENVVSITHPTSRHIFEAFLSECAEAGYATTVFRANAAEFGVPQLRKRVFVLGLRGDHAPLPPTATHYLPGEERLGWTLPVVTASEAIERFAAHEYAEPDELVTGRWARHLEEIPPGWNYKALTAWAGHPNPSFVAEKRYWHFLLKLHPDRPAWTIAANPGPWVGPFHWDSRRLRVPELAALQGFPDGYQFFGNKRSIRRQIGNAVPPALGKAVAEAVLGPILGTSLVTASAGRDGGI